jgi:hypothetical protein
MSSTERAVSPERSETLDPRTPPAYRKVAWPSLPDLSPVTWSTLFEGIGRRFFAYPPDMILKLGTDEGEAAMTDLAYHLLGSVVPRVDAVVSVAGPSADEGILITRQPGQPLVELWPNLDSGQRASIKKNLAALITRMREPRDVLDYYGRPGRQPYITPSEFGPNNIHSFCRTRGEWHASRSCALRSAAPDIDLDEDRVCELEHIQQETGANDPSLVYLPVLTHGDLSDRNILVDPTSLEITGLIDWELANVAPAYFEYAAARLCGGHLPEWRKELLDVLRQVLYNECEREIGRQEQMVSAEPMERKCEELFSNTLAAWTALVHVERSAQGYSDDCYWTFDDHTQLPDLVEASTTTAQDIQEARLTDHSIVPFEF